MKQDPLEASIQCGHARVSANLLQLNRLCGLYVTGAGVGYEVVSRKAFEAGHELLIHADLLGLQNHDMAPMFRERAQAILARAERFVKDGESVSRSDVYFDDLAGADLVLAMQDVKGGLPLYSAPAGSAVQKEQHGH